MTTVAVPRSRSTENGASGTPEFLSYLARKLAGAIVSFAVLLVIGYVIFSVMPADPVEAFIRAHKAPMSAAQITALRHQLGVDQPPLQRFAEFAWNTVQGHLGFSWQFNEPVSTLILQRLWPTLLLTGSSMILSLVIGMWLGIRSGWRPGSMLDRVSSGVSLAFWSSPTFWLGMILIVLLSVGFGPIPSLFPSGGMSTPGAAGGMAPSHIFDVLWHLVLPCLTLTLVIFAQYLTIMRSSVIDELGSPYLLTARAKGLRDDDVRRKHVVPNAMLPTVTVIFLQLGSLVTGAITVETVYSWPGLGYLTYQALNIPDLPLLEGTFVVFGASVIVMNMLADIVYRYLDPRVRRQ